MREKYVKYNVSEGIDKSMYWNCVQFTECKVLDISSVEYKSGKRLSMEICAPKLHKKFYLFVWDDTLIYDAVMQSGLRQGDFISCYTQMNYYKTLNKEGVEVYQEAFQIVENVNFKDTDKETPNFFKLMRIVREDPKEVTENNGKYLSKEELLKKML